MYPEEKLRLAADLGDRSFLMLRNHGLLTVAPSIPEAFMAMYNFEATCRIQIDAQAGGPLRLISEDILRSFGETVRRFGVSSAAELAWSALVRKLDRQDPSYRD